MSILVNGQSQVPPGFRFHPTEEELLQYYLRKKISYEEIDLDVIPDVYLNKLEPWDIQEKCKIGTTPQNDWYFFSYKDKKYPTGARTNRATAAGFWKATGRDKVVHSNRKRIGMRKTLVFYKGRAPHGQNSDWIMHEYRLDDNPTPETHVSNVMGGTEEGWVVCHMFKKKNHRKTLDDSWITTTTTETTFQMLDYSCALNCCQPFITDNGGPLIGATCHDHDQMESVAPTNGATFDLPVASQLNGRIEAPNYMGSYNNYVDSDHLHQLSAARSATTSSSSNGSYHATSSTQDYNVIEAELWSFAPLSSSSYPLCHLSDNTPI